VIFALDASPLAAAPGGIARYTAELHRALAIEFPGHRFELWSPERRLWWSCGLPLRLYRGGVALFHGTDFSVPYLPVRPGVMTVHDLSPWRAEFAHATSRRVRWRTPWLLRLGLAARVITPTEAIRREVISRFGLAPERVRAVPLGVDREPAAVERSDFFLVVGSGVRKNVGLARAAVPEGVPLRVVNADASEEELTQLYSAARALLIPSLYEGFGLPALEAMACGTPVLASRDAALMEVCGGAALHLDAQDVKGWREAVEAIRTQPELWNRLSEAGRKRARLFTWRRTARETFAVYREALRG
jgi:glycosyltransferase involved in cell wall biosynthesis